MGKHTDGTWESVKADRGFVITAKSGAYDVCLVRDIGNEDNEANAHLIAAAPELYRALESLLRANDGGHRPIRPRNTARGALAKARGES